MEKLKQEQRLLMAQIGYEVDIIDNYKRVIVDIDNIKPTDYVLTFKDQVQYSCGLCNVLSYHKSKLRKLKLDYEMVMININREKNLQELHQLQKKWNIN